MAQVTTENPILDILSKAKNQSVVGPALELSTALNDKVKALRAYGEPKQKIELVFHEGRKQIAKAVFDATDRRSSEIRTDLATREKAWRDDAAQHINRRSIELQMAEVTYSAMSDNEIRQELEHISNAEYLDGDPLAIDALFVASKSSGLDATEIGAFREMILKRNYRAPWTQNPEAEAMQSELRAYDKLEPFTVPVVTGDGIAVVNLSDLLDGGIDE